MTKALTTILILVVVVVVGYIGFGSWQASNLLRETLRVGASTAQNSGWPAPEGPADIGYKGDPRQAFGYPFQTVSVSGELGAMPAWLVPSAQSKAGTPWAIFVHGIGGRRENGYRFLPTLHEAGFPVLLATYRNDSDAPVDPSDSYAFGLTEWRDLESTVRYARENGAPSVIVVAESMGGGIVGQFLRRSETADAVSAIVLDAPAIDFPGILTDQIGRMNLPLAPVLSAGALWLNSLAGPVKLGDAVTTDALAAFPGPIFLSHGFADRVVPIGSSDELVARRRHVTEYLRTSADHIQSWKVEPARYEASLSGFLSTLMGQ